MKIKYIIYSISFLILASCSKMNDLHDKYLQGENIYGPKVFDVEVRPGEKKIQLDLYVGSQRTETIRIYWNNYKDSVDVPINGQTGMFSKLINNIDENSYIFQIVSFDKFKNKSLPFEVTGTVYGNTFQEALTNRVIQSAILSPGNLTLKWSGSVDKAVLCDVYYTNTAGKEVVKRVPMSEAQTTIADWASGLKYNTLFLPEVNAIDTFRTEMKGQDILVKASKSAWTATTDSFEPSAQLPNGGPPSFAIDDNYATTYWHTQHAEAQPGYPHWLAIDMNTTMKVGMVELTRRPGNSDNFSVFTLQSSTDGINWTDVQQFNFIQEDGPQLYNVANKPNVRYLRIYASSGKNYYAHLQEFSVFEVKY